MSATVRTATRPAAGRRYTLTAQALHWLTAALIFAALPLAWVATAEPKQAPSRELLYTIHKSVGLTVLALVALRLLWRATHPAPALGGRMGQLERTTAVASHWLLYLIILVMPISGFLLSAAAGHPTSYFGLFTIPALPKNEALSHAAVWAHVAVGQWAVYALVLLHLAATAWHVAIRRDGVLERMLPAQDGA